MSIFSSLLQRRGGMKGTSQKFKKRQKMQTTIYFATPKEGLIPMMQPIRVKIGCTTQSLEERVKMLSYNKKLNGGAKTPTAWRLIGYIEGAGWEDETDIHALLEKYAQGNETFVLSKNDLKQILTVENNYLLQLL